MKAEAILEEVYGQARATGLLLQIMDERELHVAPRHVVLQPKLCVRGFVAATGNSVG